MYCSSCGREISENAKFCESCGTKINASHYNDELQTNQHDCANDQDLTSNCSAEQVVAELPQKTNTFAIIGFILAIISQIINFFGLVGIAGTIISIIGFIKVKETNEKGRGFAIAGIIIGCLSILYGVYSLMNLSYY